MNRGEPSRGKWSKRRIALGTSAGAITVGVLIALIPPLIERSANKLHIALTGPPVPLTVVAHLFDPGNSCEGGLGWVFATTSAELPMPTITSESSAASWALANKGIPASGNYVEATIQATDSTAVVVTGLEVEVLRRRPAPHGVYPSLGGGCGGLTPDFYKANLDAHPPRITESAGQIMIKSSVRSVLSHIGSRTPNRRYGIYKQPPIPATANGSAVFTGLQRDRKALSRSPNMAGLFAPQPSPTRRT